MLNNILQQAILLFESLDLYFIIFALVFMI